MSITERRFETQVMAMLGRLHGVAARLTRNDADTEDLVADTIARAWRARESLIAPSAFPAWIFRILNNTFISDRRRASVRGQTEPMRTLISTTISTSRFSSGCISRSCCGSPIPSRSSWTSSCVTTSTARWQRYPEHYRVVVIMADMEDLKYTEIAETLKIPIGTVRSRLARARAALQETLWTVAQERGIEVSHSPKH